jgi:hypothetical protein
MDEQKIHIDNLYREKYGEFAGAPPSNVWDTLESRLDNTPKDRTISFRWIWYVLIIVVALFLIYFVGKGHKNEDVQKNTQEKGIGLKPAQRQQAEPGTNREKISSSPADTITSATTAAGQPPILADRIKGQIATGSSGSTIRRLARGLKRGHHRNWQGGRAHQDLQNSGAGNSASRQSGTSGSGNSRDLRGDYAPSPQSVPTGSKDSLLKSGNKAKAPANSQDTQHHTQTLVKQPRQNQADKKAPAGNATKAQSEEAAAPGKHRNTPRSPAASDVGDVSKPVMITSQSPSTKTKSQSAAASVPTTNTKTKEISEPAAPNQPSTAATAAPTDAELHANGQQPQVDGGAAAASKKQNIGTTNEPVSARPAAEVTPGTPQKSNETTLEREPAAASTKAARNKAKKQRPPAKGQDDLNTKDADHALNSYAKTRNPARESIETAADRLAKRDSAPSSGQDGGGAQDPTSKKKSPFSSWEFGVKAGYEMGFQSLKVNKFTAGPYAAYGLSPRVSVAIQPTIKSGKLNSQVLSKEQAYVNTNGITTDTILIFMGGFVQQAYVFQQTYDSMVVSYKMGGSVLEAEIPITLRYKLSDHFTLSGGFTLSFGKVLQITESKDVHQELRLVDTFISNSPAQPPPDTSQVFFHTSPPFSSFNNSAFQNPQSNPMRLGFLAGICYSQRRFLVELSLQQNISRLNNVPNADIRSIYTQPYIKILAGYRFK